jgi:PAS domain S-box-containing protein
VTVRRRLLQRYLVAIAAVAVALAVRWLLDPWLAEKMPTAVLYGAVAIAVWFGGFQPALVAAVFGYLGAHFLFIAPRGTLRVEETADLLQLATYWVSVLIIIALGGRMRMQQRILERESREHLATRRQLEGKERELSRQVVELGAREQQIQAFMQNLPAFVAVKDERGRYIFANRAAEALMGWTREDWYGKRSAELFPPDAAAKGEELDRRCVETAQAVESETLLGDRHFHTIRFALRDARGKPLVAVVAVDITEQKRSEAALRAAQEQLQVVADTMSVGVARFDAARRFIWVNRVYAEWAGLSPQAIAGRALREVVGATAEEEIEPYIERVLAGEQVTYERGAEYPGLGRRWVSVLYAPTSERSGRTDGWVSVMSDIHDRKLAEEALRGARQQLTIILDTIPAGILQCSRERRYLWVNPTYAHWAGRAAADIVGRHVVEIIGEDAAREIDPHIARVLAGEPADYERVSEMPGLGRRWVTGWLRPTRGADGEVDGWVAILADIHDRKQMEEALKEADRRKDQFLATLAHELRNPLAPIRNAVSILRRKAPLAPEVAWSADVIDRQVYQMSRLVDDLLDVSRITSGTLVMRKERISLEQAIDMAIETSRPHINAAGHFFSVLMPSEPVIVDADAVRLAQVFSNLLNNAARYTEAGGSICLSVAMEGAEAVVSVEDSGIGLDPEEARALFASSEPLARPHSERGRGVGLTLVRGITELHGGTVEARSEGIGKKGSEFRVRLPLAQPGAQPAPVARPAGEAAAGRVLRILVADDNADAADSLQRVLDLEGNDVRVAYDGISALKLVGSLRPDVAVIDIGMPGLNGYEVARAIRDQQGRRVVLIALTGWGQEADRQRSREAGFDHHLTKPVDPASLTRLLSEISARTPAVSA